MRTGICSVAVLIGAMGIVYDVAAAENNSSLAPLIAGYSKFTLSGSVGVGATNTNNPLDVWRVEQRLKYLAFPAMGASDAAGAPTPSNNVIQDFQVDGKFDVREQDALKLFEKVVRYDGGAAETARYNEASPGADGMIEADPNNAQAKLTTNWLNAYNAPHWMQYFASIGNPNGAQFADSNPALPGWKNDQLGQGVPQSNRKLTAVEVFGTSWIHDLMLAKQYAPAGWVQPDSTLTGTVDANLGYTASPQGHHTHDLGMAMDLGITHYIDPFVQDIYNGNTPSQIVTSVPTSGQWSMADAQALLDAMISVPKNRQDLALADFFSLYAVTQNGAARDTLAAHVSNATALNALFGDGTQANGLINGVIIGGTVGSTNTYPNMHYALQQLGFREGAVPQANAMPSLQNMDPHFNHFHIYLQPPKLEPIHTANLLMVADASNSTVPATTSDALMLADAAAKTITPEIVRKMNEKLANMCTVSENPSVETSKAHLGGLSPGYAVVALLKYKYGIEVTGEVKAVIIQQPAHGKISIIGMDDQTFPATPTEVFEYTPEKDFLGDDSAVIEVTANGQKFRISTVIKVVHGGFNDACMPPGADSGTLVPDVQVAIDDIQFLQDASAPEVATSWQSLFAQNEQVINSIKLNFADLAGGAVGQTTGEGINANITLDTSAAGNGWFIDTTPADNSEFLPTSNPNEWVAKAGSDAAGKMDMLSVLLHEYGHALGIEHSADSGDYMGTTLTVGVRRLPSATELALMQQLIAQAKGEMIASTPSPTLPLQGGGGLPLDLPISLGGLAFAGLLRPNRYGSLSIDLAAPATQYEAAANAAFTNLDTATAWQTQGSVDIASSTGSGGVASATLSEVSTSQTRLSQVFMLNNNDRYLSFTLAGSVLANPVGAPEDAFEVALLDASTGASVVSGDGLTRTDAFLNLQGDGTQNAADCVTCIYNADGSRTYRVDLTGVAKNIAVNLSFDLLGFGANNSHVTLRDIRTSGLPQLHDEVATTAEDNLLTFDPFAQADAQLKPLLASHIVAAPTHGALVMNADGTFSYTPDLNYFGADSFSFNLSDGSLDSNLATVSLTVTPVNDAPVAADAQVTTAEDTK